MFSVGSLVYRPYKPQSPGKVIEVLGEFEILDGKYRIRKVQVRWLKGGKETDEDTGSLNSFDELIEDHQKKLNNHLATKKKLEEL